MAGIVELVAQRVKHLGADADRLRHAGGADRHDHEFLDVDRVVGVHPAIDDVHHRYRQRAREHATDIAVERLVELSGRGLGAGQADTEHGIGAEPTLVRRAVEVDQGAVNCQLIGGVEARQRIEDLAIDRADRLAHAAAAIALAAISLLDRLMRSGRGARRDRRSSRRAAVERDLDLDGRVAAAVEDLAGVNVGDSGHRSLWAVQSSERDCFVAALLAMTGLDCRRARSDAVSAKRGSETPTVP